MAIFGLLDIDAVKQSVLDSVPKRFIDLNEKAFNKGVEAGNNALKDL